MIFFHVYNHKIFLPEAFVTLGTLEGRLPSMSINVYLEMIFEGKGPVAYLTLMRPLLQVMLDASLDLFLANRANLRFFGLPGAVCFALCIC
jgi:hypothetical protein